MKPYLFFLSLLALTLQAAEDPRVRNLENRVSALEQRKNGGGVILPSAGANLDDDVGICLDAELLIWKAHQTAMNFAQGLSADDTTNIAPFAKPNFRFDPGLRVQFGLRPVHDDWEIDAVWTHFYTKAKNNYYNTLEPVLPLFESVSTIATTSAVSAVWRMNLNLIDLELSRASFMSKWMSVKPYIAVRNAWLNQKYNVTSTTGANTVSEAQMQSKLWAIGPRIGLELKFGMGEGFYFFGDSSGSLLWGFFNNTQNTYQQTGGSYVRYLRPIDVHTSTYNVDMSLGLGWDKRFDDNHYRISIRGAWEHQIFFDTNYFKSYANLDTFEALDSPKGNFSTEGFTLAIRFDF